MKRNASGERLIGLICQHCITLFAAYAVSFNLLLFGRGGCRGVHRCRSRAVASGSERGPRHFDRSSVNGQARARRAILQMITSS